MLYQISRSGQLYGPYTLEDLQRYLASGNVLQSDLAKSEEMADWVPVSQIMGAKIGSSSPDTSQLPSGSVRATDTLSGGAYGEPFRSGEYAAPVNPSASYSPELSHAAAAASQYPDPPNLSWGLYLLFTILAFPVFLIFSKVFTVVQAAWLKKVQPNSKGLAFYIALYVIAVVNTFVGFSLVIGVMTHPGIIPRSNPASGLLGLVYLVLLFVTRFMMSSSIEEHFNGPERIGLKLNPVMVFLFGGIYFQYHFNQINAMKQAARFGVGRTY